MYPGLMASMAAGALVALSGFSTLASADVATAHDSADALDRGGPPPGGPGGPGGGPGGHRGPPPEAYEACNDLEKSAECSVSFHDRTLQGSCVADDEGALFCLPDDMPPPPEGGRGPTQ